MASRFRYQPLDDVRLDYVALDPTETLGIWRESIDPAYRDRASSA
jgi:hypothetical protein